MDCVFKIPLIFWGEVHLIVSQDLLPNFPAKDPDFIFAAFLDLTFKSKYRDLAICSFFQLRRWGKDSET